MTHYYRCFLEKETEHKTELVIDVKAELGNIVDGWKITAVGRRQFPSRVFIPTAGQGSRLGSRVRYFNKSLIKIGDKAVISHTIDAFPEETEFVIALGYKGDIVRQYLELTYPERKFIFVWSEKYMGEYGSGPGRALLDCREHLQCSFYYVSCDAIIDWKNRLHNREDWAGTSDIDEREIKDYCTVEMVDPFNCGLWEVSGFHNKSENGTTNAFTGVAHINNYKAFWEKMDNAGVSEEQEIQVSPSILSIPYISAWSVDWYDTGSEEGIQRARKYFKGLQNLDKADEEIYFVNGAAVKYFYNDSSVKGRLARIELLGNTVPKLLGSTRNFYKYEFIEGKDLSTLDNQDKIVLRLLEFCKRHLWKKIELNEVEKSIFKDTCRDFYYKKTLMRLDKFYDNANVVDREDIIDEQSVPKIEKIFKLIDWDWLSDGLPCIGHGDLNFSNILLLPDSSFKLIDFRQDFGGSVNKFDAYYDFAKLYCSFLLPRPSANNNKFSFSDKNGLIETSIEIPQSFRKAKGLFEWWVLDEWYDLVKIKILTEIIFLNMSPLHEAPLDRFLFYSAKKNLYNLVK